MKEIKPSGFQKGYSVKKNLSTNQLEKKFSAAQKRSGDSAGRYPNGVIPFIFILLAYLIFLIATLSYTLSDPFLRINWFNSILGSGIGYFLINLLWAIGRTGLMNFSGYGILKMSRVVHYDRLREKMKIYSVEPASKDVTNLKEYTDYCLERKNYTKKWCYISLITSGVICVISIVTYLILYYTLINM